MLLGGRGSPHTSQISHLILYPSLWLLVPGLSSQFFAIISYTTGFLMSAMVGNIFEKWLLDVVTFGNPWESNTSIWQKLAILERGGGT